MLCVSVTHGLVTASALHCSSRVVREGAGRAADPPTAADRSRTFFSELLHLSLWRDLLFRSQSRRVASEHSSKWMHEFHDKYLGERHEANLLTHNALDVAPCLGQARRIAHVNEPHPPKCSLEPPISRITRNHGELPRRYSCGHWPSLQCAHA